MATQMSRSPSSDQRIAVWGVWVDEYAATVNAGLKYRRSGGLGFANVVLPAFWRKLKPGFSITPSTVTCCSASLCLYLCLWNSRALWHHVGVVINPDLLIFWNSPLASPQPQYVSLPVTNFSWLLIYSFSVFVKHRYSERKQNTETELTVAQISGSLLALLQPWLHGLDAALLQVCECVAGSARGF